MIHINKQRDQPQLLQAHLKLINYQCNAVSVKVGAMGGGAGMSVPLKQTWTGDPSPQYKKSPTHNNSKSGQTRFAGFVS